MDARSNVSKPVVMIVDDEPMVLEVSSLMIQSLGYQVESFRSPLEALQQFKAKSGAYDLVVVDMVMPAISGKELFLKFKEINPNIKAAISSGYQMSESTNDLEKIGIQGFIDKPFTIEMLKDAFNKLFNTIH